MTPTFDNLDKYIFDLDKYIEQFEQIHFTVWTNTFTNLDKYI
jgi:beta-phosphoglucomutase-like phosphatase (HAD superfamily)